MRRAILAAGVALLAVACGTSGGGGSSPAQPGRAQTVVRAQPVTVPVQAQPAPAQAPAQALPAATAQPVRPAPAPTSSGPPGGGSGPAVMDDGTIRPCPMGTNPPLHKICPV